MDLSAPEPDEIEVSVFGRGFGEAICVHLGASEWVLIDSCIHPDTGQPAALSYFTVLGIAPKDAVRLVIVTHWHDDHVAGIARVVQICSEANVACSAALVRNDVLEFVIRQEGAGGALGSGVDELRTILACCRSRLIWAKANLPLHPRPPGDHPTVVALSPSEEAVQRSVEALIEAATQTEIPIARRFAAPDEPNGASVVASVRVSGIEALLGADLEKSANAETGWDALLKYSKPSTLASLVKLPHHGSAGANHDGLWTDLVQDQVVAIVTPWVKGGGSLPHAEDISRIRSLTGRAYLTAMPTIGRARIGSEVETLIRRLHGGRIHELRGWGHVRARRRAHEDNWRVELDGDAVALS